MCSENKTIVILNIIHHHGYTEVAIQGIDYGVQIDLSCGVNINCFNTGSVVVQGKNLSAKERISRLIDGV